MSHTGEQRIRGRRVAVFGAAGFVGAEVMSALVAAGAEPCAVASPQSGLGRLEQLGYVVRVDRVDVRDRPAIEAYFSKARPDLVLNAVRPSGDYRSGHREMFETIVAGTHNLLQASAGAGCERFVQLGSASEYGGCDALIDEALAPIPESAFGGAKAAATMLCLAQGRSGAMASAVLRPFMVYGPRDVPTRLVPTIIRSAFDGTELQLTPAGNRRDWVFVSDVADACIAALGGGADGHVVHLGTGVDHDNEDLVALVQRLTGREIRVSAGAFAPRPWDRPSWVAATAKARALLGWEARTSLAEGLRRTIASAQDERSAQVTSEGRSG